jgi:hypothetical protein
MNEWCLNKNMWIHAEFLNSGPKHPQMYEYFLPKHYGVVMLAYFILFPNSSYIILHIRTYIYMYTITLAILNTFWGWIWIENPSWGRIGPKSILRMVFRLVVFLGYPWEPAYPKFRTHFYPDGLDLKPSVADFSHMHIDATSVVKINH